MSLVSLADLKKFSFFRCFPEKELTELLSNIERKLFPPETFLFKEEDQGKDLFLIEKGLVEILKRDRGSGKMLPLSSLKKGDVMGEMAWIDKEARFASAKASVQTQVFVIPSSFLSTLSSKTQLKIHQYFSKQLSQRLKTTGKLTVQALKKQLDAIKLRLAMGRFIVYLTVLIFLYFYSMIIIERMGLKVSDSTLISVPILTLFAVMMIYMMRQSQYPLKMYGLTWKNGWRSILESLGITAGILALMISVKWWLISDDPALQGVSLFQPSLANYSHGVRISLSYLDIVLLIGVYCIFTPVQELIYRGALQSSLQTFFMGRHKILSAILISNLPFSMIHLHLSFRLAIAVYFFGLLWGWMYARHKTLVGVVISHLIIGAFAFFILGIQAILRA